MANTIFGTGVAYSTAIGGDLVYPSGGDTNNVNIVSGFNKFTPPTPGTTPSTTNGSYGGTPDYDDITYNEFFNGYINNRLANHWFTTASQIDLYKTSELFYQERIEIPSATSNTKFRAHIILENSTIAAYTRAVAGDGIELVPGELHYPDAAKVSVPAGKFGFRVVAEDTETVVCSKEGDFNGQMLGDIPVGTTTLRLETYEAGNTAFSDQINLANPSNFVFTLSNPRVYKDGTPSLGIGTRTDWDTSKAYIEPSRIASLSVHNIPESGYYSIVADQVLDGVAVDYFVVGDTYQQINYIPSEQTRNACIEFQNVNVSLIDPDQPIELVFDVVDIDSDYVEERWDHFVEKSRIKEWCKRGDREGLGIECGIGEVAGGNSDAYFPGDYNYGGGQTQAEKMVSDLNSPPSVKLKTLTDRITPGLNYIDITAKVHEAIKSHEPTILIWLSFVGNEKYKWLDFHIGMKESNKPRIRYRPELQPIH